MASTGAWEGRRGPKLTVGRVDRCPVFRLPGEQPLLIEPAILGSQVGWKYGWAQTRNVASADT